MIGPAECARVDHQPGEPAGGGARGHGVGHPRQVPAQ